MPVPRRTFFVVAAVVVVVGAAVSAVAFVVGGGDVGPAAGAGPTAVAATRDLSTTLDTTGKVERSWQRTVSYAAALPRPDGPGGASLGDGATASTPGALTLASSQEAPPATTDPTTPAEPTGAAGADPATEPVAPAADPSAADPSAPATSPTTAAPADPSPPTTTPADPTTTAPADARTGQPPAASSPPTTTATPPTSAPAVEDEEDPAVLTAVAALGSSVANGTVLYAADDEPVVAVTGTVPAWRTLEAGVDGGADVRQLEAALVALGHGAGVAVDDDFTSATAAAVKRWETALGRAEPDGVVEVGDVVFVAEAGIVLAQEATVGDPLEPGTPVLVVGSRSQRLAATVAAGEAAAWAPGTQVDLTWSDGSTTTGTVAEVGREVSEGTVELTVALSEADAARPTGAEADIATVDARRDGAVTVPVSALVAGSGGTPAVRRPAGPGRPDRVVPVTTGIVSGTWVEVVTGLAAGDAVRLPG